jgi:hypothetical protein
MEVGGSSGSSVGIVSEVLETAGLTTPDGRPLHNYRISSAQHSKLKQMLRSRLYHGYSYVQMAAPFVLWAAEHVRSAFLGGPLTWAFIFQGLDLPEDRNRGVELVQAGLPWWRRSVRVSEGRLRLFLYSLMAEGGLPQALLNQQVLYRRVVLGLLAEIEAEGGVQAAPFADRIASRWVAALPQTFQTADFARLMVDLGLALARLRAELPEDLSEHAAEWWLDRHHPGWAEELPLRMSSDIAEQLIRPALGSARGRPAVHGPLAIRELCRDQAGKWDWFLRLHDTGFFPDMLLPEAADLRLRLLPASALISGTEAPVYTATPDQGGWQLCRIGRRGTVLLPLEPQTPFVLGAFADGRPKGEIVVAPGIAMPAEAPSFWRAADPSETIEATRLVAQPGSGRAKAPCLWLLGSEAAEAKAGDGISLHGPEPVAGGKLWRVSGRGSLSLGVEHCFRIETSASEEAAEARLVPVGEVLPNWRIERDRGLVYRGMPRIFGEIDATGLRPPPDRSIKSSQSASRDLGEHIVEWVDKGELLARLRLTCLPRATQISLVEDAAGHLVLTAEGLAAGLRITLRAGAAEARGDLANNPGKIVLIPKGVPSGHVTLRLADIHAGTSLRLVAPWPARSGLILDADGNRLERDHPLAADGLIGWRALLPDGVAGELSLRLAGHPAVALSVSGEVQLYPYLPLIRAMLAQGGPDAQVDLRLVVHGREGPRLQIRRYEDHAVVENDRLRTGLLRDTKVMPETALSMQLDKRPLALHAVNLNAETDPVSCPSVQTRDLRALLGDAGGSWLIQSKLDGRTQRAVVWSPRRLARSTREDRIAGFSRDWRRLIGEPDNSDWEKLWHLIVNVGQGGDAGVADQAQALAQVPEAAVALVLRVPQAEIADALSLDVVSPLFWPTVSVAAFAVATEADYGRRLRSRIKLGFTPNEAAEEASIALSRRIAAILSLRSELAGHFGAAIVRAGLMDVALKYKAQTSTPSLFAPNSLAMFNELAQEAARRFERLPTGLSGINPRHRPHGLAFNRYAQSVIDAPLTAAEFAADTRPPASVRELIALINLRLVDPIYFDAALPAAIAIVLEEVNL